MPHVVSTSKDAGVASVVIAVLRACGAPSFSRSARCEFESSWVQSPRIYVYLAPNLKTCSRNDPNFDECTFKNGVEAIPYLMKGDPKYKLSPMSPLKIAELSIVNPNKGSSATGLDITLRNLTLIGLEGTDLKKAHFDLKNKKIELVLQTPELQLYCQYEIDGKISLLPIKGKGDGSINITDVGVVYRMDYNVVTKQDGQQYAMTRDTRTVHTAKHIILYLSNLFNGDKTLGESTNAFLNENWQVINEEIVPPLAQGIGEAITQLLAAYMDIVPYDELFPETV